MTNTRIVYKVYKNHGNDMAQYINMPYEYRSRSVENCNRYVDYHAQRDRWGYPRTSEYIIIMDFE